MKKVLLDTSILIDFLRRKKKTDSLFVRLLQQQYQLYISIVTHTELFSGKKIWENEKLHSEIEILCSGLHILPLETEISKKAGKIRAQNNTTIMDAIIAATAINHGLSLVTLNLKDFENIEEIFLHKESTK